MWYLGSVVVGGVVVGSMVIVGEVVSRVAGILGCGISVGGSWQCGR